MQPIRLRHCTHHRCWWKRKTAFPKFWNRTVVSSLGEISFTGKGEKNSWSTMPEEYTNVKSWYETYRGWYFNAMGKGEPLCLYRPISNHYYVLSKFLSRNKNNFDLFRTGYIERTLQELYNVQFYFDKWSHNHILFEVKLEWEFFAKDFHSI